MPMIINAKIKTERGFAKLTVQPKNANRFGGKMRLSFLLK